MTDSQWSGRFAFILAAAGSAIGLGNIWKFPYITGENGGGAFVLIYLLCIALVGLPIFLAELYVGQKGGSDVISSFEKLDRPKTPWRLAGGFGLVSAVLILSFYSVVGGWILDFAYQSVTGQLFEGGEARIKGQLSTLLADPNRQILSHAIFMLSVMLIVLGGVKNGLERWNKILMPALLALLAWLLINAISLPGFGQAMSFLFSPDASKLTQDGLLEAVGHSFFTLSLGMGAILVYGSYLKSDQSLPKIAVTVAFMDTAIALIAGLVIFSVVFSYGLKAESGPGLIFATLPVLFSKMSGGHYLAMAFFLLVTFAAFTSAVSILEVAVSYWQNTFKLSRHKATLQCGLGIFSLGLLNVLSNNVLARFKIFGLTFFDLFDKLTSSYLLPLGGLVTCLFFGWKLGPKAMESFFSNPKGLPAQAFLWTARIFAPLAVIIILLQKLA